MPTKIHRRNEPFYEHLLPPFRVRLQAGFGILAHRGILCVVTRGFATREEQVTLHERYLRHGPLAAPPGKSWHEYGCAGDCVPFRDKDHDLVLDQDEITWNVADDVWKEFIEVMGLVGLNCGKGYGDFPHVDYHPGLSIRQAQGMGPPNFFDLEIWGRLIV